MSEKEHAEKRALIAMSGGVDSSVAAALMLKMGYECIGVTMKLYSNEDIGVCRTHTCCSLDDVEDARAVAGRLGMRMIFRRRSLINLFGPMRKAEPQIRASIAIDI